MSYSRFNYKNHNFIVKNSSHYGQYNHICEKCGFRITLLVDLGFYNFINNPYYVSLLNEMLSCDEYIIKYIIE